MKRIGDILIANGWIEPSILQRALVKQKETGHRLCSLLVLGGALGADDAACALGEQHGVAAALQRHLTRRDQTLASLLSPALARACVALPLGRMGNGDVIVCVRDPSPALETQLGRAMKEVIRLAVAPAHQLEELVLETYGSDDANEFDVDLSTGPIMSLELEDDPPVSPLSVGALADIGSLELVDLDHTGVSKDESQHQLLTGKRPVPAPVVDAPSYRSPTALSAARTTIPRETFDDDGIAIPRTQTPMSSGLDAAGPASTAREQAPPGRAALAAAGPAVARTQTPRSTQEEVAVPRTRTPRPDKISDGLVDARTRTPGRSSLTAAAAGALEAVAAAQVAAAAQAVAAFELGIDDDPPAVLTSPRIDPLATATAPMDPEPMAPEPMAPEPMAPEPMAPEPMAPEPVAFEPAAPAPMPPAPVATPAPRASPPKTLIPTSATRPPAAAAVSMTAAPAVAPAAAAVPQPMSAEPVVAPAPAPPAPKPVIPLPSIAPPRSGGVRPPPAALAALQRASSIASRVPHIPPRPIPALPSRPTPVPAVVARAPDEIAIGTQLPAATLAGSPRLSEALAALSAAPTVDRVCDALMAFAAQRWSAVLALDVDGMAATGRRGHGAQISDDLAQWIVMSLAEPSLLQAAFAFHQVATATPDGHGDVEHRLQQLLGQPRAPSAIAISVEGKPLMILAVGDPDGEDLKTAAADLERLGDGAARALTRLRGR